MTLLAFENVDAYYGEARILTDVSFAIDKGERAAVLGRNGVGKTTIVNTLCGLTRIRAGRVRINGRPHDDLRHYTAAQSGIGLVLQGRAIIPNLTVEENLLLGAAAGRKGEWTLATIYELFPALAERGSNPGTALSGGQQQMLAIGRALMSNPDLLVLDEPSEGLAPVIVDELARMMVRLADDGTAILLIEQNTSLIQRVADRYHVLSKGRVTESGNLEGMSSDELHKHIVI
jgi:branched-chain amino acid transport system ATP-binding protein